MHIFNFVFIQAIFFRLANKILAEMIIDFQRDEMDQVVRTLYNLEFN